MSPALIGKNFIQTFFSCDIDCIVDMVTINALAKMLSLENYYNTKIAGFGKNFIPRNFSAIRYSLLVLGGPAASTVDLHILVHACH